MSPRTFIAGIILAGGIGMSPSANGVAERIPDLLSVSAAPAAADTILVFAGGGERRIRFAASLVESGYSNRILVVGNRAEEECALSILLPWARGRRVEIETSGADPANTLQAARVACRLVAARRYGRVLVVTSKWHSRRTGMFIREFAPNDVSFVYCSPPEDTEAWWKDPRLRHNIAGECIKLVSYGIIMKV